LPARTSARGNSGVIRNGMAAMSEKLKSIGEQVYVEAEKGKDVTGRCERPSRKF
jgi:hypothetical protein